jgi:hypothetical protein
MTIPLIVLALSLPLLYVGIGSILSLIIKVICFWGEVIWKDVDRASWEFKPSGFGLVAFVVGLAGMLWSVIVLAIHYT